jgi:methylglyoxal synthase
MPDKPRLVIVGSSRAQQSPTSPLLRLTRDFAKIFRMYEIHATSETADAILGTGMYAQADVTRHRHGADGGITQLAAMIARREVAAAILFLDPNDPWSDAVENRAMARVCIHRQVRLITTYAAALRWVTFEAKTIVKKQAAGGGKHWKPSNWTEGKKNIDGHGEFQQIPIEDRSIALISHDGKKHEMVDFLSTGDHLELLAKHQRILATGTTGWLLKLLFCDDIGKYKEAVEPIKSRIRQVIADILKKKKVVAEHDDLDDMLDELRAAIKLRKSNAVFSEKVMPLPSGPDGGDVIAADEILNNLLHEVIFFQDPLEAHPHSEDIRLFERTSRLPGVFSECVSDKESAHLWMDGLRKETKGARQMPSVAQRLRSLFGLKEVVLVESADNKDGDALGTLLARASAGYLNHWISTADRERQIRIGVAWGWGLRQVLNEVKRMHADGLLVKPSVRRDVVWSPIIGIITARATGQEADMIADGFKEFYGGTLERFGFAGFAPPEGLPKDVAEIVAKLVKSDLILTSGSDWDRNASLAKNTGLDRTKLPRFNRVAGTVSGVFLDQNGNEVKGEYQIVGVGHDGLKYAALNGTVVLTCGGSKRNRVVLAALRAKLVSVLVSTRQTAEWVLDQATKQPAPPPKTAKARAKARARR